MSETSHGEEKQTSSHSGPVHAFLKQAHTKIGLYGWIAIGLWILLIFTVLHYERRESALFRRWFIHEPFFYEDSWTRDFDQDFARMQAEMQNMRSWHNRMMQQVWQIPSKQMSWEVSSFYASNDNWQYSINTRDGKLDGFASGDAKKVTDLLPKIQKLGLATEQKDNKVFFNGSAMTLEKLLELVQ